MKKIALVLSCEHAVDTVPKEYRTLFAPFKSLLASHRGIDFGALEIAQQLHQTVPSDFIQATATRLLIDCNRSLNNRHCFSEVTETLATEKKQELINQYYEPFREHVTSLIKQHIKAGFQVIHLSIHSFTPVMNGLVRNADIGLLYDPGRPSEKKFAKQWQLEIKKQTPRYKIRMNYPYNGISDGFTSAMRKQFSNNDYVGIEVESNQSLTQNDLELNRLKNILALSLFQVIC